MTGKDVKDVIGSLLLGALGLLFLFESFSYRIGTATQMGPGFYPMIVAGVTIGISAGILLRALSRPGPRPTLSWRPMFAVLASIVAFAIGMKYFGLVAAVFFSVAVSSLGEKTASPTGALILAIGLSVGTWLIFSLGLGLPIAFIKDVM